MTPPRWCATDGAPAGPGLPPYCRAPPPSRAPAVLLDRRSRLSGVALRPALPCDQLLIIGRYADEIGRRRSSVASSPE
jgi:hypothetical protein